MVRKQPTALIVVAAIMLTNCEPVAPDIRIMRSHNALFVDIPWTFWRRIGLQHPSLCVRAIEIFEPSQVVWNLRARGDDMAPCVETKLPIRLGIQLRGFVPPAPLRLVAGRKYGIYVVDVNRVDFVPFRDRKPTNISDYGSYFEAPCESRLGIYSKRCQ